MPHLYRQTNSPRHLRRSYSKHLGLKHPGYSSSVSNAGRSLSVSSLYEIPYDENFDSGVLAAQQTQFDAAAAPTSETYSGGSKRGASYYPAGGQYYSVTGFSNVLGTIYAFSANSGAPFGESLADLFVKFDHAISNASLSAYMSIGSGSSSPTGSPLSWGSSGTISSSGTGTTSDTLSDFVLKPYVWAVGWFIGSGTLTAISPVLTIGLVTFSISNIRYRPAS